MSSGSALKTRACRSSTSEVKSSGEAVHIDNDISALKGAHRPGYAALLASVQRGELDRIVAMGSPGCGGVAPNVPRPSGC